MVKTKRYNIGVVGGIEDKAAEVESIISEFIDNLEVPANFLVYGDNQQISRLVSKYARNTGFQTIGIVPVNHYDENLCTNLFSETVVVHPRYGESIWGDESEYFVKSADAFYIIGGGNGTMIEYMQTMKYNESLYKQGSELDKSKLKYIVSHYGMGGFSEKLYAFQPRAKAPDCFPNHAENTPSPVKSFPGNVSPMESGYR